MAPDRPSRRDAGIGSVRAPSVPFDPQPIERLRSELDAARAELAERRRSRFKHCELIRRIHESLLPRPVRHPRVDIDVRYLPMEEAGGDYCQVLFSGDSVCYITICDVAGHGIGPALLATRVSSEVRRLALEGRRPMEIVQEINAFVLRYFADTGMHLSLFAAGLDLDRRSITYSGAGHPGPLLIRRAANGAELLASRHLLLGVSEDILRDDPEETVSLAPGDRLVFYTDGLTESRNPDGEWLGESGLASLAAVTCVGHIFEIADCILRRVDKYRAGPPQDDITLIVAEMK